MLNTPHPELALQQQIPPLRSQTSHRSCKEQNKEAYDAGDGGGNAAEASTGVRATHSREPFKQASHLPHIYRTWGNSNQTLTPDHVIYSKRLSTTGIP
ncbi:hypothetical protein NMY22_g3197 [Coprinellus aureogranulatus]|nr:hypothetical protein NMY22_g3197 [Coprinellus aureogranulatus]